MSNVPKSTPTADIEARFAALRAEFPGFEIGPSDTPSTPYRAVKKGGGDKAVVLLAGSYGGLRALLFRQDEADSERALLELSKALVDRGAVAIRHSVSIVTKTRTGIARTVGASRGRFIWDSGNDLGSVAEVDEVALKIVRLLGMELHPQLGALARGMGVRKYKVDVAPPEVTVTTPADVSPPRAVRVTCEPRAKDGGADWFWTHWGDPIAPADNITGAEVALVGLLAADS